MAPTRDGSIVPPDTSLAVAAHRLVSESCPAHVVAHCERSYRFAVLLARTDGIDVDDEVLYLGVLMHDLGLAPRFQTDVRFDVGGANAARDWLLEGGMEAARAEVVWDIVALHASSAIAQHKSPETAVANSGISIDVRGAAVDRLSADAVRRVLDAFPAPASPKHSIARWSTRFVAIPTPSGCRGWRAWPFATSMATGPPTSRPACSDRPNSSSRTAPCSARRRRNGPVDVRPHPS